VLLTRKVYSRKHKGQYLNNGFPYSWCRKSYIIYGSTYG
jgi:hypothetical protein